MQRAYRLTNNASFNYIYRKGENVVGRLMAINYVKAFNTKVGVSVSKKIGKSVTRNLVKRRIKENFATIIPSILEPHNYVVVARSGIENATFQEIGEEIKKLLSKVHHIN